MTKYLINIFVLISIVSSPVLADPFLFEEPKTKSESQKYTNETMKLKFEYPSAIVSGFVQSCSQSMVQMMGMNPEQAWPIAMKMCSCIMDEFRSDFKKEDFVRGGRQLAVKMGPQYGETCRMKMQMFGAPSKMAQIK